MGTRLTTRRSLRKMKFKQYVKVLGRQLPNALYQTKKFDKIFRDIQLVDIFSIYIL